MMKNQMEHHPHRVRWWKRWNIWKDEVFCEFHSFIVFSLLCGGSASDWFMTWTSDPHLYLWSFSTRTAGKNPLKILQNSSFFKRFQIESVVAWRSFIILFVTWLLGGWWISPGRRISLWWKIKVFNCHAYFGRILGAFLFDAIHRPLASSMKKSMNER